MKMKLLSIICGLVVALALVGCDTSDQSTSAPDEATSTPDVTPPTDAGGFEAISTFTAGIGAPISDSATVSQAAFGTISAGTSGINVCGDGLTAGSGCTTACGYDAAAYGGTIQAPTEVLVNWTMTNCTGAGLECMGVEYIGIAPDCITQALSPTMLNADQGQEKYNNPGAFANPGDSLPVTVIMGNVETAQANNCHYQFQAGNDTAAAFCTNPCGNGTLDVGEECDFALTPTCCTASCTFATAGTDPNGDCDDADACTVDSCDGAGACAAPTAVTCDDGIACTTDGCDSLTGCTVTPVDAACDDFDACTVDTCDALTGCGYALNDSCDGLWCPGESQACDGGANCTGCFCDAGFAPDGTGGCVSAPCAGQPDGTVCSAASGPCDLDDTCQGEVCTDNGFATAGTVCLAGSDPICDPDDTCDGATATCPTNVTADGTVCSGATGPCDLDDTCQAGACTDNGFETAGTVCLAGTDPICDPDDTCDGASASCAPNTAADGTVCLAAAGECDLDDTCFGAACTDNGFATAGTACTDDGDACTLDECDGTGICAHPDAPANCGDGNYCATVETCDGSAGAAPADGCTAPEACDGACSACTAPGDFCTSSATIAFDPGCSPKPVTGLPSANASTCVEDGSVAYTVVVNRGVPQAGTFNGDFVDKVRGTITSTVACDAADTIELGYTGTSLRTGVALDTSGCDGTTTFSLPFVVDGPYLNGTGDLEFKSGGVDGDGQVVPLASAMTSSESIVCTHSAGPLATNTPTALASTVALANDGGMDADCSIAGGTCKTRIFAYCDTSGGACAASGNLSFFPQRGYSSSRVIAVYDDTIFSGLGCVGAASAGCSGSYTIPEAGLDYNIALQPAQSRCNDTTIIPSLPTNTYSQEDFAGTTPGKWQGLMNFSACPLTIGGTPAAGTTTTIDFVDLTSAVCAKNAEDAYFFDNLTTQIISCDDSNLTVNPGGEVPIDTTTASTVITFTP